MKKVLTMMTCLLLILGLAACGGKDSNAPSDSGSANETAPTEPALTAAEAPAQTASNVAEAAAGKTLVVYYSATNNTEAVAGYVAEAMGADIAVLDAIGTGYRMIDTAAPYGNEEAVGRAIRRSGVCREDLFITSKLWVSDASYDGAKRAFEASLARLGLEYLDLYLLHQPMGDYYGAYRAMEELYEQGLVRAIGVCNFYPHVLADFCETVEVIPTVNQVELHPFFQQPEALALMADYEVQPEAWGPFAEGGHGIFTHPLLTEIGAKYGKSAAQVALRWNVQRGVAVIPKSVHRERMAQNRNIWDFELDEQEMASIAELDTGRSEIVNHFDPAFVRALHGRVMK